MLYKHKVITPSTVIFLSFSLFPAEYTYLRPSACAFHYLEKSLLSITYSLHQRDTMSQPHGSNFKEPLPPPSAGINCSLFILQCIIFILHQNGEQFHINWFQVTDRQRQIKRHALDTMPQIFPYVTLPCQV